MARSIAKAKRFPIEPRSAGLAALLQSCVAILAINWVFQGIRGMQAKEASFRVMLTLGVATLVAAVLQAAGVPVPNAVLIGLLAGHTLNFTANGQLWVAARYCAAWHRAPDALDRFLVDTTAVLRAASWLDEAVLIGSIAVRGRVSGDRADLDLRLVFPPGLAGWLRCNLMLLRLRMAALLRFVPLDLYAYDRPDALARFDQREPLGIILDRAQRIAMTFPQRQRVTLP